MEQHNQHRRHNKSSISGSMQIDNDEIFNLLMKLNESVSGLESSVRSQSKKLDRLEDSLNSKVGHLQSEIDQVSEVASNAENQIENTQDKSINRINWFELVFIPVLASIIPNILPHIHIH